MVWAPETKVISKTTNQLQIFILTPTLPKRPKITPRARPLKDAAEHLKQLLSKSSRASEAEEEVERKRAAAYEAQLLWAIARQSASQHK